MSDQWHYKTEHAEYGPVSSPQLKQFAENGSLKPTHLVRKGGMTDWVPAAKVKGLFADPPSSTAAPATNTKPPHSTAPNTPKPIGDSNQKAHQTASNQWNVASTHTPVSGVPPNALPSAQQNLGTPRKQTSLLSKIRLGLSISMGIGCVAILGSCLICGVIGSILGPSLPTIKPPSGNSTVYRSSYDGSVAQVKDWIKFTRPNPRTLEFIEWTPLVQIEGGNFRVACTWRYKDFTDKWIVYDKSFVIDPNGKITKTSP